LLLVASVNVSNLLLQRTHVRRTEIAVRVALGAGRSRIMRQIVLESLILSVAGAACGVLLAWLGVRAVVALRPAELEMLRTLRMDGGVIVFAITVSAMVGLFFGLLPALRSTRTEATAALSGGARAGTADAGRVRWVLVAAEVALSFALLVSAGLVALSLHRLATRDPGYAAKELISIDVRLPAWRYAEEAARAVTFDGIVSNIRRIPTVRSVSLAGGVPPRMAGRFGRLSINGGTRATTPYPFDGTEVDTAFFATIGEPIIAGRAFTRGDATSALNPVIVAESAARALFPGLNPLGQRFSLEGDAPYTVIGVARDIHPTGLAEAADEPLAYWPLQRVRARMTVVVRADAITAQLLQDLRQIVRHAEPDAVVDIATVEELLRTSLARERFTTSLLSGFAALALLLAAIGLYGVLSQVVLSRTREIGVRVAMGASAARIAALVLRAGMSAVVIGLVFGGMLAAVLVKLLRAQVFGITAMPSVAYGGATVAVLVVAAAAIAVPALHAARLDPVRAIRVE
jgi:putative ABC transport system permease protein